MISKEFKVGEYIVWLLFAAILLYLDKPLISIVCLMLLGAFFYQDYFSYKINKEYQEETNGKTKYNKRG